MGGPRRPNRLYKGYVFDLDGTVYLGDELLPGAGEAIHALKQQARVVYLTNNPLALPRDYARKLTRLGIETSAQEIVSSVDALLAYLAAGAAGARLFVVGERVLIDALGSAGYAITERAEDVDVVVVSFDRTFDYGKLKIAFDAVKHGARIVATNPDPYCPSPDGGLPDCAAMLAAVEACTGARAEAIVGKPSRHMATAVLARLGLPAREALLAGDRLATDIRMAREVGMASALVLTGATGLAEALAAPNPPDYIISDLQDLVPPEGSATD